MTTTTPITTNTITPTVGTASTVAPGTLSSSDFMNLMIQQLQNQDPLNPTDSNQLLQQISQISTLQANTQLQTSLTGLTLQQSHGAAGNLIGKAVQGIDGNGNQVAGNVTAVQVQNQQVFLTLDSSTTPLPMSNVTNISLPITTTATTTGTTTTPATPSPTAVQSLLSALQGIGL
jgi:flagellar basal-body rod modification protein FlgD